jgi:hypothetical protein
MMTLSQTRSLQKFKLLAAGAAVLSLLACGGGGSSGDNPADVPSTPAPAASSPPPALIDKPMVIDAARRAAYKRALLQLIDGSYGTTCASAVGDQPMEGGGPITVDAGGRAGSAAGSLDLLNEVSQQFGATRDYRSGTSIPGKGFVALGAQGNLGGVVVQAVLDPVNGPMGTAGLTLSGSRAVFTACGGPTPLIGSADLFGVIRPLLANGPVRMRDCSRLTGNPPQVEPLAGSVVLGARSVSIGTEEFSIDRPNKLDDHVLGFDLRGDATLEYAAKWEDRTIGITFDDAGLIRSVLVSDFGTGLTIVTCDRPVQ